MSELSLKSFLMPEKSKYQAVETFIKKHKGKESVLLSKGSVIMIIILTLLFTLYSLAVHGIIC